MSHSDAKIFALCDKIRACPEILLDEIVSDYTVSGNKCYFPCPVHNGDNKHGAAIFLNSNPVITWRCFTRHCEARGKNIFNLIAFSRRIRYNEAVKFCSSLYEGHVETKKVECKDVDIKFSMPKSYVPSRYFLERGFSPYTLKKFRVGFCYDKNSVFFGRHVAPIFNLKGDRLVGMCGRTFWNACLKCGSYHDPNKVCPNFFVPKWKFNKGCPTDKIFYNFAYASKHIGDEVILVEGQSDVWRLYEAGYYNSMGLLGGYHTKERDEILKNIGVKRAILIMDNDAAGRKHAECFKRHSKIPVKIVRTDKNDISDCSIKEVKDLLK